MVEEDRSKPYSWLWRGSGAVRLVIVLLAVGGAMYAEGTSEGTWLLIGGGILIFAAGVSTAIILVKRWLARRA